MGRPRVPPVPHICERCGIEFLAVRRDRRRYCGRSCAGAANTPFRFLTGPANNRFRGGLSEADGRTIIICRNYKYVFFYRAVMEAHLGRELRSDEIVHHINGDPTDDRLENLQLVTRAEHIKLHHQELRDSRWGAAA